MSRLFVPIALLFAALAGPVGAQQTSTPKLSRQEAALRAEAKISEDAARATALAAVPGSSVKSSELEKEDGKLIWTFDLKVAKQKGIEEVHVDAITGKVAGREHESKKEFKKEAKRRAKAAGDSVAKPAKKKP